ncbi:uncharacterized protein LOC115450333 [Manduca sexta]|uniref:uncharacterized protein LOC115450333 n=1 Tax=Manduca sexta TaxID=7130 RepID=UPI0018905802|nr:uncharacterized protein LOC115450333 [Manduca sexta]
MATKLILLILPSYAVSLIHQKPVAEKVWSQKCTKGSHVLNDCNWCHCDMQHKFNCKARICSEVDMFGHFNDAIREIDVGMEGHGVWRSSETPCEPRVHYRRKNLLCVCGDDGTWPNPVCRDIFQNLHPVEIIEDSKIESQKCTPSKFHLIGCNICFCPTTGRIDPDFCTKKICNDTDPAIKKEVEENDGILEEVYLECNRTKQYKLGCQTCECLRNNRLLCDNCTKEKESEKYCDSEGKTFNIECNTCTCDDKGLMHCTTKKCLSGPHVETLKHQLIVPDEEFTETDKPVDDHDCEPGTLYKKDCNSCYCFNKNGMKMFACTFNSCSHDIHSNCVQDTVYEMNCFICHCVVDGERTMQVCLVDNRCTEEQTLKQQSKDLRSLHGYCEPLHTYKRDCNTCRCNADGKSAVCTSKKCSFKPNKPISVDIIPVIEKIGVCPVGHYYRIDCNVCFCLSNGNAICTTSGCKKYIY